MLLDILLALFSLLLELFTYGIEFVAVRKFFDLFPLCRIHCDSCRVSCALTFNCNEVNLIPNLNCIVSIDWCVLCAQRKLFQKGKPTLPKVQQFLSYLTSYFYEIIFSLLLHVCVNFWHPWQIIWPSYVPNLTFSLSKWSIIISEKQSTWQMHSKRSKFGRV